MRWSRKNPFPKLSEDQLSLLGMMAKETATRPSAFFEWNEPDEWQERYWFDVSCVMAYNKQKNKAVKSIKKRR